MSDTNPPAHYAGDYEPWDFCEDLHLNSLEFNVVKYLCRAGRKGATEDDIAKARVYLDKLNGERRLLKRTSALIAAQGITDTRIVSALAMTVCRQYDLALEALNADGAT